MAKYLDGTGLGVLWDQIKSVFLSKSGGTMTGTITTSEGNHAGIKIGSTYITSAGSGNVVFQNNTTGIRFGTDAWDYNQWAGLKYVHSSKIIYLGLADGSVFTANTAQSGGKLYTPGIDQICVGNGTYTVYHTGNLPAYPTKDSWNYDDRYLKLSGGTISNTSTNVPLIIEGSSNYSCISFTQSGSSAHSVTFGIRSDGGLFVTPIDNWNDEYFILHTGNYTAYCATAGHKHNYSQIEAGNISLGAGTNYINLRTGNASYDGGVYYSTPGNEAVVFANKNTVTSWMFAPGVSPTSLTDWTTITPSLQIKNGTVAINKQIANGASLSYNLDVNGSANATTLYQNGVQVSVVGHTHSYLPLSGGTLSGELDVNSVFKVCEPDDPGSGKVHTKLLSYSPSPYGLVFRGYSSGVHSIQVQRESNNSEVFGLSLQPLGGNVGIGTTSPSYKLDVSGTVNATTIREGGSSLSDKYAPISHTHSYLPLSGGTLSGNIGTASFFSGTDSMGVYFEGNSTDGIRIQYPRTIDGNNRSNYDQLVLKAGELKFNNYLVYHSGNFTPGSYLPLSGGTMTGVLTLLGSQYNAYTTGVGALNLNNSDITGVNSILTSDLSEGWSESIGFKRSNGNYDTIRATDGTFYLGVNNGTEYTAIHSGNYSSYALPLSGGTMTGPVNISAGNIVLTGQESNNITTKSWPDGALYNINNSAHPTGLSDIASIRNSIRFSWYSTNWVIGNIRGAGVGSEGFGICYENSDGSHQLDCFRVTPSGVGYLGGNTIIHSGNIGSQSVSYATTAGSAATASGVEYLNNYSAGPSTAIKESKVKWFSPVSSTNPGSSGYAGDTSGFAVNNNANGILYLGTHSGKYGHQLGFSSNGNIYHRYQNSGDFPSTANGGSWETLLTSSNYTDTTDSRYLKLTGGTLSGALQLSQNKGGTLSADSVGAYLQTGQYWIRVHTDGGLDYSGNTIWHAGNFNPSSYLPLTGGTVSGKLTISSNSYLNQLALNRGNDGGTWGPSIAFYNNGSFMAALGVDVNGVLYRGDSGSTKYAILHEGNYTSYCATSDHNHDSVYVKKVGDDVSGTLKRTYTASNQTPMLWMDGYDYDNYLWQISSGTNTKQYYGYGLKYVGTGSGVGNLLRLIADNQGQTDITAIGINQNGQVGIGTDPSTDYRLYVNGSAKINSGSLQIYPVGGSWNDGIRIHARSSDSNWAGLMLCGSDNTGDTGTSANSWFIGNNTGNFYITRNGSSSGTAYLSCVSNVWSINGNAIYHTGNLPAYPTKDSWNYDDRYLKLSGGTLSGSLGFGNDNTKFLITTGTSGSASPLRGTTLPATSSNFIGIFARPGKATDEGGILLSEDTCIVYNSHDTGAGFVVVDTDLSQADWSASNAVAFKVTSDHTAWALGGFVKSGATDSDVLLGGGGHKAESSLSVASAGSAHDATNLVRANSGFTTGDAGWYKLASIKTTDPRGSIRIGLITTGGSWIPEYAELMVRNGWGYCDFIQSGQSSYITKYRLTYDDQYSYIEAYFPSSTTIGLTKFNGLAYVNDYTIGWTLYSTATAGSGTVVAECSKSQATSKFYANGYIESSGFVVSGASDSHVLLAGGGIKSISDFATSGHTHYIGTTAVQSTSGTQSLTGIGNITAANFRLGQNSIGSRSVILVNSPANTPADIVFRSGSYTNSTWGDWAISSRGNYSSENADTKNSFVIGRGSQNDGTSGENICFKIDHNTNVIIGNNIYTEKPQYQLDIRGDIYTNSKLVFPHGGSSYSWARINEDYNRTSIRAYCTAGESATGARDNYSIGLMVDGYYSFALAGYDGGQTLAWRRNDGNWYDIITSANIGSQNVSTSGLTQYQRRDNFIQSPKGGTFTTSNSTYTGYLRIKLPCGMINTMLSFFVDIYDYNLDCSVTYKLAGYSYSGGWVHCTAQCVSSYEGSYADLSVRFGTLDGNAAVEIGESNTSWSYPQVLVRDFVFGYSNDSAANYFDSWTIDFSTTSITVTTYGGDRTHSEFLNKGLKAKYAASAGSVAWSNITGKPSDFDSALTNAEIDAICT